MDSNLEFNKGFNMQSLSKKFGKHFINLGNTFKNI